MPESLVTRYKSIRVKFRYIKTIFLLLGQIDRQIDRQIGVKHSKKDIRDCFFYFCLFFIFLIFLIFFLDILDSHFFCEEECRKTIPSRQDCRKISVEECIFVYMALHIECRFNKNSLLQCYFLAILQAIHCQHTLRWRVKKQLFVVFIYR